MQEKNKLEQHLIEIVDDAQSTSGCHQKCVLLLKRLYKENDYKSFFTTFKFYINKILKCNYKAKNSFYERSISFAALFLSTIEKEETNDDIPVTPLLMNVINFLCENLNCSNESRTFRACQLISQIFSNLLGSDLSEDLCSIIEENLLRSCTDPITAVRIEAFKALCPLQDPQNNYCPAINMYLRHMRGDPQAKVREVCVSLVLLRRDVIPYFINISRDVNFKVRLAVYKRAAKSAKQLKIINKQILLRNGFNDTVMHVKKYVKQVLCIEWLKYYDSNYIKLIDTLVLDSDWKDLENTLWVVENVLNALFELKPRERINELCEVLPFNSQFLLPIKELNWNTIMYWRFLLKYLRKIDVEAGVPEFLKFCQYIFEYFKLKNGTSMDDYQYLEDQFILQQFFYMVSDFDVSDPACKNTLNNIIHSILKEGILETKVIKVILANLDQTFPNINEASKFTCNVISEIMYEATPDVKMQEPDIDKACELEKLRMQRNCLRENMENCIKNRDFLKADEYNQELLKVHSLIESESSINEIKECVEQEVQTSDPVRIMKYLDIANAFLSSSRVMKLSPMLAALKEKVIQPQMTHENSEVMYRAWKGFGLCCLIDYNCAKQGMQLFSAPIYAQSEGESCSTEMLDLAIETVSDIILIFGTSMLAKTAPDDENNDSFGEKQEMIFRAGLSITDLVKGLVDLLDNEDSSIQKTVGQSLCKWILLRRIQSSHVISHLIVKWCLPASDDEAESRLKAIIGLFLQKIPFIKNLPDQLEDAIPIVIKTIVKAPPKSPLADINVDNVGKILIELTKTFPEAEDHQYNLALKLTKFIFEKAGHKICLPFSKMLLALELTDSNQSVLREISSVCEEIKEVNIYSKSVLTNITKFHAKITVLLTKELTIIEEDTMDEYDSMEQEVSMEQEDSMEQENSTDNL